MSIITSLAKFAARSVVTTHSATVTAARGTKNGVSEFTAAFKAEYAAAKAGKPSAQPVVSTVVDYDVTAL